MSTLQKITANIKDVGGIPVARLLPTAQRRSIGAWCFLDHAGPAVFTEGEAGLQVGAHPHIGLQTFTWMLAGEVLHKDSLGNELLIRKHQVNLMTAGRGISHTEQTPAHSREVHAVQLWIALPESAREVAPAFVHYPDLPMWSEQGVDYVLTTGQFGTHSAPTQQYSPLLGLDMIFKTEQAQSIALRADFEYGFLVLKGSLLIEGVRYEVDELAYLPTGQTEVMVQASVDSHVMLLGGEPLAQEIIIWWNFVGTQRAQIDQAVADWNAHSPRFGSIDTELKRLVAPVPPWSA
jgi:hypothetical protein